MFNQDLINALRERQADNVNPDFSPITVSWSGAPNPIPCCAGDNAFAKSFGIGGFGQESDLILIIVFDDLPEPNEFSTTSLPQPRQTVTYNPGNPDSTKQYRVIRVTRPPGDAFIALHLEDITKGI